MAKQIKKKCNTRVESEKIDLNKGDEEKFKSHKYAAAPEVYFYKTLRDRYNITKRRSK